MPPCRLPESWLHYLGAGFPGASFGLSVLQVLLLIIVGLIIVAPSIRLVVLL